MNDVITRQDDVCSLFEETSDTQADVVKRAKLYLDARKRKEECEEEQKRLNLALGNCETELLRSMDAAGVKSLKVEHDGRNNNLSPTKKTFYSLPKSGSDPFAPTFIEDETMLAWLGEHGGMDLIKKTIHHSTFSSFCGEIVKTEGTMKLSVRQGLIFIDDAACGPEYADEVAQANGLEHANDFVRLFADREFIVDDKLKILLHPSVKIAERRSIMVRKG